LSSPHQANRLEDELHTELAEVVVEVLVHAAAPLLGSEGAEEGMGMAGAFGFTTVMEGADAAAEPFPFA